MFEGNSKQKFIYFNVAGVCFVCPQFIDGCRKDQSCKLQFSIYFQTLFIKQQRFCDSVFDMIGNELLCALALFLIDRPLTSKN